MRVVIYSEFFPPSIGGGEQYAFDLASFLNRLNIEVFIITSTKSQKKDNFPFQIQRLTHNISFQRMNLNFVELMKNIIKIKPEIVHINSPVLIDNFIIILLKLLRIKVILSFHAPYHKPFGIFINKLSSLFIYNLVDVIFVQSNADANRLSNWGISLDKIKKIYFNGIENKNLNFNSIKNEKEKGSLLFVGQLDESHTYKGLDYLLQAVYTIKKTKPVLNFSLKIVGSGNLLEKYEMYAKSMGLKNITFLGYLEKTELEKTFQKSCLTILPSSNGAEGFGRVVLESIVNGTPVLVSKYAGISELIETYDAGIIFDPKNLTEFCNILISILEGSFEMDEKIANALTMIEVEKLGLDDTIEKTIHWYKKVMED